MSFTKLQMLISTGALSMAFMSLPSPSMAQGQDKGNQNKPDQTRKGGVPARPTNQPIKQGQQKPNNSPKQPIVQTQVHARREVVRTPNYVPKPTSGPFPVQSRPVRAPSPQPVQAPARTTSRYQNPVLRPTVNENPIVRSQRNFTKTANGRIYDNGVILRRGTRVTADWQKRYFPRGHYSYTGYRPTYTRNTSFISPFGFYFGVCVPFISSSDCRVYPPAVSFIDEPIYNGAIFTRFNNRGDDNLIDDPYLNQNYPGLGNALDELNETFQAGNIDGMVALIDPNTYIAIYQRGQYKYSISATNYVDLTRDALQSTQTLQFQLTYLHQRSPQAFSVSGRHTYRDGYGNTQTMWVSFVLEDMGGQWTLTQVETSPARYQNLIG